MLNHGTSGAAAIVFLVDVDNTLLDNDRFGADLGDTLEQAFGKAGRERYWAIYEEVREQCGFADYFGALQRFRTGLDDDPSLLQMSRYLLEYPFAERLYPGALDTLEHLRSMGTTVILSDGDVVFQPCKVRRAGLWDAVRGNVLVYVHKQHMLAGMRQRYPAAHYVMVDDKPWILAEMKQRLGERLTTVFVRQGHYAAEADPAITPAPDRRIERIADLRDLALDDFLPSTPSISLPAD